MVALNPQDANRAIHDFATSVEYSLCGSTLSLTPAVRTKWMNSSYEEGVEEPE